MEEYRHVVIVKNPEKTLGQLKHDVHANGLQTAHTRGIHLASGSQRLEHHLHVFLWDGSKAGIDGRTALETAGNCFTVKVRWKALTESGRLFQGTLKGDNMQNAPPSGRSTNGAWAYKGDIPRKYLFIDEYDSVSKPGFAQWMAGDGWP